MEGLSITVSFFAGIVSFLSPCIIAIVPGFLSYLAGASLEEAKEKRKEIFLNSLFFVLGFSLIFAVLGVLLNTVLERVAYDAQIWLARIGGLFIIIFGLYLTGIIKIKFLEREHKFRVKKFNSRYFTSLIFGAAFAAGWTPCVGAVLGAILGLAATNPGSAFTLLLVYALGLGLPFLLVGLFTSRAAELINKHAKALSYAKIIFGIILIIIGIFTFTRNLGLISNLGFISNLFE